jgi:hypothetical protein
MQQLLTIGTELVRLGGWQASRPPGFPRCGTPFPAEFKFQFSQRRHNRSHGPAGRGGGVDAFA